MMDFGKALRAAREAKGLSIAQLAETTRLAPTTIINLENDDFQHIAAPIYGRGFVRLYCESVGLDPKPFLAEYMEIMQGNRMPAIKERPPVEPKVLQTVPEAVPTPVAAEPPQRAEAPFRQTLSQSHLPPQQEEQTSRYAAPPRTLVHTVSSSWRLVILAVGVGIALALVIFGLRALHRATSPNKTVPQETATAEADPAPEATAAAETTAEPAKREQQAIPALYID